MQKVIDAKRKGEAKVFWMAVIRGLGVFGKDGRHSSGSVVA